MFLMRDQSNNADMSRPEQPDGRWQVRRRRLLRAGVGTLGTALTAGCLGIPGDSAGGPEPERQPESSPTGTSTAGSGTTPREGTATGTTGTERVETARPAMETWFADDWEDGDHEDPLWIATEGRNVGVVDSPGPDGGEGALRLIGNPAGIRTGRALLFGDGDYPWTLRGAYRIAFAPDRVERSDYHHSLGFAFRGVGAGENAAVVRLGYRGGLDGPERGVGIDGGRAVEGAAFPAEFGVEPGRDYRFLFGFDGRERYRLWVWPAGESRPSGPIAGATGRPLSGKQTLHLRCSSSAFAGTTFAALYHSIELRKPEEGG